MELRRGTRLLDLEHGAQACHMVARFRTWSSGVAQGCVTRLLDLEHGAQAWHMVARFRTWSSGVAQGC